MCEKDINFPSVSTMLRLYFLNCSDRLIFRPKKKQKDGTKLSGNFSLELCRGNTMLIVNGRIGNNRLEFGK